MTTTLAPLTTSPLLWYLNRSTGAVLMVLLTLSLCLGILATRARAGGRVPGFLRQDVHRAISLVAVALLAAHVVTAVLDEYVDIRWWQAFSPIGATYKPLWMGLGALALDLIVVVTVTSIVRAVFLRAPTLWRALHLTAYAAWGISLAHGLGIGTDAASVAGRWVTVGCVGLVLVAALVRVRALRTAPAR